MSGMMTQQLGFSILSAPLAAIDRRALSQAWYSALHLAREHAAPAQPPRSRASCAPAVPCNKRTNERGTFSSQREDRSAHASTARHERGTAVERRAVRSPLARKIERVFLDPVRRPVRATFTLGGASRVHVALQSTSGGVRLIALCAPELRTRVARALDEARYALARRGIALDASIGEHAC